MASRKSDCCRILDIGVAAGFIHKVRVCSDVPPVRQNLLCETASEELKGFEAEGIIQRAWVSSPAMAMTKSADIRLCVDLH